MNISVVKIKLSLFAEKLLKILKSTRIFGQIYHPILMVQGVFFKSLVYVNYFSTLDVIKDNIWQECDNYLFT